MIPTNAARPSVAVHPSLLSPTRGFLRGDGIEIVLELIDSPRHLRLQHRVQRVVHGVLHGVRVVAVPVPALAVPGALLLRAQLRRRAHVLPEHPALVLRAQTKRGIVRDVIEATTRDQDVEQRKRLRVAREALVVRNHLRGDERARARSLGKPRNAPPSPRLKYAGSYASSANPKLTQTRGSCASPYDGGVGGGGAEPQWMTLCVNMTTDPASAGTLAMRWNACLSGNARRGDPSREAFARELQLRYRSKRRPRRR